MQALVQKVREQVREHVGDDVGDDAFVRAELARAYDDLRYGSVRLRPAASIMPREEMHAEIDAGELVRLAARRVASLGGTQMPAREAESNDMRLGTATRAYEDTFSFASRCELPRENEGRENRRG